MKKYTVMKFGVDEKGNEYDTPIWEGEANNQKEAVDKAAKERYPDPDDADFMKGYLIARPFEYN